MLRSRFSRLLGFFLPVFVAAAPQFSLAQGTAGGGNAATTIAEHDPTNKNIFTFDYTVPTSPALQLAGLTSASASTENSLKPFIFSLPGLLDSGSKQGSATLDLSPAWVMGLGGEQSSGSYYESSLWNRWGFRSHVGFAAFKGSDGGGTPSKAVDSRLAIGYSVSLLDSSDPLMAKAPGQSSSAWFTCLNSAKVLIPDVTTEQQRQLIQYQGEFGPGGTLTATTLDQIETLLIAMSQISAADHIQRATFSLSARRAADLADIHALLATNTADPKALQAISKCAQTASDTAQHNFSLDFGFGAVFDGKPGAISKLKDPGIAVWLSGRLPIERLTTNTAPCQAAAVGAPTSELGCWTIGGTVRWGYGEFVATGNQTTPSIRATDISTLVGVERTTESSKFAASAGYLDQRAWLPAQTKFSESGARWLVSGSLALKPLSNLLDGVWLVGSYGTANGTVSTLKDQTFLLTLNFTAPKSSDLFGNGS